MLAKAFNLAARGIPVFPCSSGKTPLTTSGFKDATADLEQARQWWQKWPDALIGVPTGDKFVVVDLDLQHADADEWRKQNIERFPATRCHVTRSGGLHLLFRPNDKVGCTTSRLGPHIDTRGKGGYIIWWPGAGLDVHDAGTSADVPQWVVEALNPPPHQAAPSGRRLRSDGDLVPLLQQIFRAHEGERNTRTFWVACRLAEHVRAGQVGRDDMINIVVDAATRIGLPRQEANAIARSALRTAGA